jgi:hypothetical protein
LTAPAGASGDYGCYPDWNLENADLGCSSSAAMAPGNDTRVNLTYLLQQRAGTGSTGAGYPDVPFWEGAFGRTFFDWDIFRRAQFSPAPDTDASDFLGSRCVSFDSGTQAFLAALAANGGVKPAESSALANARHAMRATCTGVERIANGWNLSEEERRLPAMEWPKDIRTRAGKEFLSYLMAANAFYSEDWVVARETMGQLRKARDPWIAETATYMHARVNLNAAQAVAFDQWGFYGGSEEADRDGARVALAGFDAYLAAYPQGLYAASAQGLRRRALWVMGEPAPLAAIYEDMLSGVTIGSYDMQRMIEEVDDKLLGYGVDPAAIDKPLLLATIDLKLMRTNEWDEYKPIAREALEAQAPVFAGREELYSFLLASHAYYVAKDYGRVMELIPDAARQDSFSPLQFSRQVLRGMALNKRGDRLEAGFWQDMLGGTDALYQRPLVEMALAMNWERNGKLSQVFADGSQITDSSVRIVLLEHSAGQADLRKIARATDRPAQERAVALYTLLWKDLSYGRYADFLKDRALVPAGAEDRGAFSGFLTSDEISAGVFTRGDTSESYACPDLGATVKRLAANAGDVQGLICLGEFYRLNGFDYQYSEYGPDEDELGGGTDEFPGTSMPRQAIYQKVLAMPGLDAKARSYALFRAVWCYGPSGNNSCGGDDVPEGQRRAWFRELKGKYANTQWARDLEYYW